MSGLFSWSDDERRYARLLGAKIAAARKALGLTQEAVARKLQINQVRVSAVERGRSDFSRKDIAKFVGVAEDKLDRPERPLRQSTNRQ